MMEGQHTKHLQWACRRGMLELDILLKPFLDEQYSKLMPQEKIIFEQLLKENDQDLFEWLTNKRKCENSKLVDLIKKIQEYAIYRHSCINH